MFRIASCFATVLLALVCGATSLGGAESTAAFDVEFSNCVESIGVDLIPTAIARRLVPEQFVLAGEGGPVTPIVVRTARCGGISVDGRRARPGVVVQIGVVIVPPDFSGDINIYALWYFTSDGMLAKHLQRLGMAAQHVSNINYDLGPLPAGMPCPFAVDVRHPARPTFSLDGTVTRSATESGSFEAIWWMSGCDGFVRMDTSVPQIFIGEADLALETNPGGDLGAVIGGDSLEFPILQQFNTFRKATMDVSVVVP